MAALVWRYAFSLYFYILETTTYIPHNNMHETSNNDTNQMECKPQEEEDAHKLGVAIQS
jgi:hypothetical protein